MAQTGSQQQPRRRGIQRWRTLPGDPSPPETPLKRKIAFIGPPDSAMGNLGDELPSTLSPRGTVSPQVGFTVVIETGEGCRGKVI